MDQMGPTGTRSRLELELARVRAEATRMRLEARAAALEERAAEIELLLLDAQPSLSAADSLAADSLAADSLATGAAGAQGRPGVPLAIALNRAPLNAAGAGSPCQRDAAPNGGAVPHDEATGFCIRDGDGVGESGSRTVYPSPANSHRDAAEALLRAIRELVATGQADGSLADSEHAHGQQAANDPWQHRLEALQRRQANRVESSHCDRPEADFSAFPSLGWSPPAAESLGGNSTTSSAAVPTRGELEPVETTGQSDVTEPSALHTFPSAPKAVLAVQAGSDGFDAIGRAAVPENGDRVHDYGDRVHEHGGQVHEQLESLSSENATQASAVSAAGQIVFDASPQQHTEARAAAVAKSKLRRDGSRIEPVARRPRVLPRIERPQERSQRQVEFATAVKVHADEDAQPQRKRMRPAAWLVSTIAHLAVLVLLGLMTLSTQRPRDQLAFAASVAEASEDVMETFTIEVSETPMEEEQTKPEETALEISPIGTVPIADVALELPDARPGPLASDLLSSPQSLSSLSKPTAGETLAKVSFAGVEGGGNHFIYLVDSSNSMRNFNEARLELLRSIDSLESHQRFYVVFYDQDPDYMRLRDPAVDEPTSVLATPTNKAALRRWAMTITQERGKSPIDVLQFAFKLRPDVIFLLSDGEFSARTEVVIREHNRQENLFGEAGPISIIHTIRYPGFSAAEARSAEVQMKRIAQENGGVYRNVQIP